MSTIAVTCCDQYVQWSNRFQFGDSDHKVALVGLKFAKSSDTNDTGVYDNVCKYPIWRQAEEESF